MNLDLLALLALSFFTGCSAPTSVQTPIEAADESVVVSKPYPCSTIPSNASKATSAAENACIRIKEFGALDKNNDRFINVKKELKGTTTHFKKADHNEDGRISIIEFMALVDKEYGSYAGNRICINNATKKPIVWDLTDTRINANGNGHLASMGAHQPNVNGDGFVCVDVPNYDGPYLFLAHIQDQHCMIRSLTGNAMVTVTNDKKGMKCVPQRDGFNSTATIAKEFPVDYYRENSKQKIEGFPLRNMTLRNNTQSKIEVSFNNPQGKRFDALLSASSALQVTLDAPIDEYFQPITLTLKTDGTKTARYRFSKGGNLKCERVEQTADWPFEQNCGGALIDGYGFTTDLTENAK
ncbi:MAG: hypothetical protein JST80_04725 [Bdellovibrionales bacterium]|nr:hypothetical protein [Bdellovibrionales bacterium]